MSAQICNNCTNELKDKRLISYDADSIGLVWKNGYMID